MIPLFKSLFLLEKGASMFFQETLYIFKLETICQLGKAVIKYYSIKAIFFVFSQKM